MKLIKTAVFSLLAAVSLSAMAAEPASAPAISAGAPATLNAAKADGAHPGVAMQRRENAERRERQTEKREHRAEKREHRAAEKHAPAPK